MRYSVLMVLLLTSTSFASEVDSDTHDYMQQARDYCQSMVQDGTPDEEVGQFLSECMSEQTAYLSELNEASKPDCYEVVDTRIQEQLAQDPDYQYDFDKMLDSCLNENEPQ